MFIWKKRQYIQYLQCTPIHRYSIFKRIFWMWVIRVKGSGQTSIIHHLGTSGVSPTRTVYTLYSLMLKNFRRIVLSTFSYYMCCLGIDFCSNLEHESNYLARHSFSIVSKLKIVAPFSILGLHSLRASGATAAANAEGVSERCLKRHGRWKSDNWRQLKL